MTGVNRRVVSARFLFSLAMVVWLGGLAFVGMAAAPAVFKIHRSLGPQMVGAMLERFTPATYLCAGLLLASWLLEYSPGLAGKARTLWIVQGTLCIGMLGVAIFTGTVLMNQLAELQPQVVSRQASPVEALAFNTLHESYRHWTSLNVFLGLGAIFAFVWRSCLVAPIVPQEATTEGDSFSA